MKRAMREAGFAVLAWLIPFAVALALSPLKPSYLPLFDTLMGVVVAATAALLGCIYLRRVRCNFIGAGVRIGLVWLVVSWLLDGLMFSGGPMKMTLADYLMDIGLAYLAIPAVTIGLGVAASGAARRASAPPR
jgi:hypothetical protein